MIDPRNLPHARVCLLRLSTRDLPPNALQQYHKYAAKRKRSDPALIEAKELNRSTISVKQPTDNYSTGANNHPDTGVNRSNVVQDLFLTRTSSQTFPLNTPYVPEGSQHVTCGLSNNATETAREQYPTAYSSCSTDVSGWSTDSHLDKCKDKNIAGVLVQPLDVEHVLKIKGNVLPCRRNSVRSTSSSGSSKGRELSASVRLSPVTWSGPTITNRKYVNYNPKALGESNDKTVPVVTDHNYALQVTGSILESQGLLCEQMPSVRLTSGLEERSSVISDESTLSASFSSLKDHSLYGHEEVWPDFDSYSPPESPEPQSSKNGDEIFLTDSDVVLPMEAKISVPLKPCNRLLSPKISLSPVLVKDKRGIKRKCSMSSDTPSKRKSLSPKGDLVVKLNDVGDKLERSPTGGLTVATSTRTGQYTSFGRRILAVNYSEKSLAKSVMKRTLPTEVKKRKAKRTRKCLVHKDQKCTCRVENQRGKPKKRTNKPRKKDAALLRYENLPFKELNTISRISTRYKVAFSKWPYVFSGALDLINQRISNQNLFWNSIRS